MKGVWPDSVRVELRAVDRESAMNILIALTRYGESGLGDIKSFSGDWNGDFRLRVGDFRVIFEATPEELTIVRVRHRSEVYR